jgi:uncharacterized protein YcfJ
MKMKYSKLLLGLALPGVIILAVSGSAVGYNSEGKILEAPVISANPIYRTIEINNPRQQCWEEAVAIPQKQYESRTPEIVGALLGAAVGYQFGSGRGQDAAAVAGAVLGGSIARDAKHRNRQSQGTGVRYEQRCKTVNEYHTEERLEGYDVTYQYDGDLYTTRTKHDPGSTIRVSVSVVPVE